MFPAEIIEKIISHCNRDTLITSRGVCNEWFWMMDTKLSEYRWEYTLSHKSYEAGDPRIVTKNVSSVYALNIVEASLAFLIHVRDPVWCNYVKRIHLSCCRSRGRIGDHYFGHNITVRNFLQNPKAFARLFSKLLNSTWGLYVTRELSLTDAILPYGSWRLN